MSRHPRTTKLSPVTVRACEPAWRSGSLWHQGCPFVAICSALPPEAPATGRVIGHQVTLLQPRGMLRPCFPPDDPSQWLNLIGTLVLTYLSWCGPLLMTAAGSGIQTTILFPEALPTLLLLLSPCTSVLPPPWSDYCSWLLLMPCFYHSKFSQ